jgi:hypothetical protein
MGVGALEVGLDGPEGSANTLSRKDDAEKTEASEASEPLRDFSSSA